MEKEKQAVPVRAEAVMDVLLDLERRTLAQSGAILPPKPAWARALFELPLNLAGYAFGLTLPLLPDQALHRLHLKVYELLGGGDDGLLAPGWKAAVEGARSLHERAAAQWGGPPAILAVLSHPPVGTEVSSLNYALMGWAFAAVAAVRGRPCRTMLLGAVDPFALDAAPFWQEGLYAGALLGHHLALDRQPSTRGLLQRLLFARARPERAAWRLAKVLSRGGEAAMMMSGGVEPNSRLLYTSRELFRRWRRSGRPLAGAAGHGLEHRALEALAAGEPSPADSGRLSPAAAEALSALAAARGLAPERLTADLKDFETELARALPYRRRLFESVLRRVLRSGRSLLLLPLTHGRGGKVEVSLGEPVVLRAGGPGAAVFKVLRKGPTGFAESQRPPAELAAQWVGQNFD